MSSPTAQVPRPNRSFRLSARSLGTACHLREKSEDLWHALRTEDDEAVSSSFLVGFLERAGLRVMEDARFSRLAEKLDGLDGVLDGVANDVPLTREEFIEAAQEGIGLIKRVSFGQPVVPSCLPILPPRSIW